MTSRVPAFLLAFLAATCASPQPTTTLRITEPSGAAFECTPLPRTVRRTTIVTVEEHAFEVDACGPGADCRPHMKTRYALGGAAVPDFRKVLRLPMDVEIETEIASGPPCRWRLVIRDATGANVILRLTEGG